MILGYTGFLLESDFGPLTAEQREALQIVDQSAKELLELIVATLEASQLETGRPPVEHAEVDMAEVIADLRQEMESILDKPTLSFAWQVAPALPRLYTDRAKLKLVLKNLLSNAAKFTPEGNVTVEVFPRGEGVEFRVTDTGVGIAPEVMPVIFDLFRQGNSSTTRRYQGMGLGLYIVRQMVELLGGTVTAESRVGHGSIFHVWLPTDRKATV